MIIANHFAEPKMPKKFSYKYSKEFHEICQPIFDHSPITFCSIGRIFNDGTYSGFMSDPVWTEHYVAKHQLPTLSLWLGHEVSQTETGFALWSISSVFTANKATQSLQEDCHLFHYNNGVNFVDKYPDFYEATRFASPKLEGIESFFIEKHSLLRNYILYIKEKLFADPILAKEFNTHYTLAHPIKLKVQQKISLLPENLGIIKFYLGFPLPDEEYLTQRELDCLLPFMLGIPKKQVSHHLKISVRTIETHLENIKMKCHCKDLTQLKLLFNNNPYLTEILPQTLKEYLLP